MASVVESDANTKKRSSHRILNINVGVLGHVDSGKTSLVKALSTQLSTASLDKHPESRRRGITLDLGFSAFKTSLPEKLLSDYPDVAVNYDKLQFTLVDCPGHASLIRTMITGAQIIDIMILVIDVNKGIQMQTAECLIIGEVCSNAQELVVVLNKIDLIDKEKRDTFVENLKKKLGTVFSKTKFANCTMVPVSAAVGGEKRAAVTEIDRLKVEMEKGINLRDKSKAVVGDRGISNDHDDSSASEHEVVSKLDSIGMDILVEELKNKINIPKRSADGNLLFAVDHCFSIKGKGTILTGTVLSGGLAINDTVELPALRVEKKIKSIQMFRRPVGSAIQGDRLGICVAGLDAKSMERGFVATPGTVLPFKVLLPTFEVKQFFFKGKCGSKSKIHISVGHTTAMATVTFFGSKELAIEQAERKSKLSSTAIRNCFDASQDYMYQDELVGGKQGGKGGQWALIEFDGIVMCPLGSLLIGSRLDTDVNAATFRIAFYGRLIQPIGLGLGCLQKEELKIYKLKQRTGVVDRVDKNGAVIVKDLFEKNSDMTRFLNMKLISPDNEVGNIEGPFGKSGKVKVSFSDPGKIKRAMKLTMNFKKYVFDENKKRMYQD